MQTVNPNVGSDPPDAIKNPTSCLGMLFADVLNASTYSWPHKGSTGAISEGVQVWIQMCEMYGLGEFMMHDLQQWQGWTVIREELERSKRKPMS